MQAKNSEKVVYPKLSILSKGAVGLKQEVTTFYSGPAMMKVKATAEEYEGSQGIHIALRNSGSGSTKNKVVKRRRAQITLQKVDIDSCWH